nr:hypothetical protein [Tanacetum cinerariifolium]
MGSVGCSYHLRERVVLPSAFDLLIGSTFSTLRACLKSLFNSVLEAVWDWGCLKLLIEVAAYKGVVWD